MSLYAAAINRLRLRAASKYLLAGDYEQRGLKSHATRARRDAEALEAKAKRLEAKESE